LICPELLEAVARALAAALIPAPRRPPPSETEEAADFLTAAQLARRLGVSRETVRRLAILDAYRNDAEPSIRDHDGTKLITPTR
jgi:hypothetical protein